MGKLKWDLTGIRFGRLTVISRAENDKNGKPMWNCVCDCGTEKVLSTSSLQTGTKSCGCYRREWASTIKVKHGGCRRGKRDRLYSVWNMIKQRCLDPNCKSYKNYGGRGITICDEWSNDYETFRTWSLQNGYDPEAKNHECTIDRIDNDKGYSPDNCRWVEMKVQARNTRANRIIEYNGEEKTLAEWGEETGILPITIHHRLKSGWTLEEAMTLKPNERRHYGRQGIANC